MFYAYKNVNSQFKNNLCEKAKADTRTPNSRLGGGGRHSFISEIAVFTLETDYSWQMGYPFGNSRQIGSTSSFENGMVLILNKPSAWLYPPILTDSLKMDYPFQIAWVQSSPSLPLPPPADIPSPIFSEGEGAAVHWLSETDNPSSNCPSKIGG